MRAQSLWRENRGGPSSRAAQLEAVRQLAFQLNPTLPLAAIELHLSAYFAGHPRSLIPWGIGPIREVAPDFRVLALGPGPRCPGPVYASVGACNVRPGVHLEFLISSPVADPILVETLAMVTYYHHTRGLDVGHTFPIGRPWLPGASCEHFLVSLPYPFAPGLERAVVSTHEVRFLWLLPVYGSEVKYRHKTGLEGLEELLESRAVDYLDIHRAPVA